LGPLLIGQVGGVFASHIRCVLEEGPD
jgi:hypothetical protein